MDRAASRTTSRTRAVVAWALVILLGTAPVAVADIVGSSRPDSVVPAQLVTGTAGLILIVVIRPLRPLARFAAVLVVLAGLLSVASHLDFAWPALQRLLGGDLRGTATFGALMQPGQTAKLLVALAMIALLLAMGLRPRDFFLRIGSVAAPIRPVPLLGFPQAESWRRFGLVWGFGIAGVLAIAQWIVTAPTAAALAALPAALPAIVLWAALNAFSEGMALRAPMIATSVLVVGDGAALWMSAVYFGVAHYFGVPGGAVGATLSIFMGFILSKAMIETRGLLWPWAIHFLSDVVIFSFLAMSLAPA